MCPGAAFTLLLIAGAPSTLPPEAWRFVYQVTSLSLRGLRVCSCAPFSGFQIVEGFYRLWVLQATAGIYLWCLLFIIAAATEAQEAESRLELAEQVFLFFKAFFQLFC